jgi:hypothetical protein
MPSGSKPGERRGGRQKGTRNKRDALFYAAASSPDVAPLDFMLALMRDPQAPIDVRLDMAVAAAPFVHTKPRASRPPPTSVPESEMEELGPTMEDILNQATLRRQQE